MDWCYHLAESLAREVYTRVDVQLGNYFLRGIDEVERAGGEERAEGKEWSDLAGRCGVTLCRTGQ